MSPTLAAFSEEIAALAKRAAGHVVAVHGRRRGASSGFAWRPGVIVTVEDTLEHDEDITVTLPDGQQIAAELAGRDPSTAVAALKIPSADLPSVEAADVAALAAGHVVLAAGRREGEPFAAFGFTALAGGPWRSRRGGAIDRLIRLDLSLDYEAEGGPVFDVHGRVLGMAVFGPRRRVLAIPIGTVARVAEQLLARGRIARGYLGLSLQPVRLEGAQKGGAIVVNVDPYGPGRRGGVLLGDVITAWDGEPISGMRDALTRLGSESVGRTVTLSLLRAGAQVEAAVTIGERPAAS